MTPAQIIGLARDVAQCLALGFIIFWIYRSGGDRVKVQDMVAVQKQLTANTAKLDEWKKEAANADNQRATDLQGVRDLIAQHNQPLLVRTVTAAPRASTVPDPASPTPCAAASSRGTDAGPRGGLGTVDLRPDIARIELKYESALADCRAALAKWPH